MFLKRGFVVITDLLNSSAAGSGESQSATPAPTLAPAQIIQIDELWRDVALADIVEHESEIGCLARTRTKTVGVKARRAAVTPQGKEILVARQGNAPCSTDQKSVASL